MSDEEIEFLGTKPAVPPVLQRPVTEIILHVERNGTNDPYRLSFHRSSSSVIHVGRRPGVESEARTRDIDSGRAMFRCAVVSRKHAKIAFTDSGRVYLIDLSSHHGTHVRKPSEMFAKPLKPEVAFQLSDGDIVTFGKPVGRHEECVRPVVVRVELVRNPQPIKPLVVPSTPSDKSSNSSSSVSSSSSSMMKHSTGRYGVYVSSSSDERPSSSMDMVDNDDEHDSENEAASAAPKDPGSLSSACSAPSQSRQGSLPLSSGFGRAFDMLKRLIPPSHTPNIAASNPNGHTNANAAAAAGVNGCAVNGVAANDLGLGVGVGIAAGSIQQQLALAPPAFTLAPIAPPSSEYVADIRFDSPSFNFWPFYSPSPPYPILPPLQEALSFSPQPPTLPRGNNNTNTGNGNGIGNNSCLVGDESRSSSPMDLESPSPGPFAELPEDPEEDNLRPFDDDEDDDEDDVDDDDDDDEDDDDDDNESVGSSNSNSSHESRGECQSPSYSAVDSDAGSDVHQREKSPSFVLVDLRPEPVQVPAASGTAANPGPAPAAVAVESNEVREMKQQVEKLQADVTRLDDHRRKYRTRFNSNVHKLADKLSHYDDRLAEVNAQYDNLAQKVETLSRIELSDINNQLEDMSEQLENLAYVDIPDLQSQVDSMGEDVVGLSSASSAAAAAAAAAEVVRQGNLKDVGVEEEAERRALVQKEAEEQVKSLKELVQEMKELRDATKVQVLNIVNELKETCKTPMDEVTSELVKAKEALAAAVATAIAESAAPVSLKRKREDEDEEASTDGDITLDSDILNVSAKDAYADTEMVVDCGIDPIALAPSTPTTTTTSPLDEAVEDANPADPSPRPRKRLRRVATVIGQTATAVTIGAVATWTVLAFA